MVTGLCEGMLECLIIIRSSQILSCAIKLRNDDYCAVFL